MMQLCSYETDALGYSSFCPLFTEGEPFFVSSSPSPALTLFSPSNPAEEFQVYEQYYDIA